MMRQSMALLRVRWLPLARRALLRAGIIAREAILIALVLAPIVLAFAVGVLFAVGRRMVIAAREGFQDGRRLIDG
jgi:hypothetical protein